MCGCIVTKEKKPTKENKVVAVLSTSVMPKDGTYSIKMRPGIFSLQSGEEWPQR